MYEWSTLVRPLMYTVPNFSKRNTVLVDKHLHPQTLALIKSRAA
jgi:glycine cleavage system pyridoxal-binding protein P